MKTAFRKFFKLETDFQDEVEVKLSVLEASKEILEYSGLKIRETDNLNEIEVYFQGIKNGENIKPFPKLAIGETLYFGVEIDKGKLEFKDKSIFKKGQILFFDTETNITKKATDTPKIFIIKPKFLLNIRKTKTLFSYENNDFGPNENIIIKNSKGVIVVQELVQIQQENDKKILNFSFDFSLYPMGFYSIEIDNDPAIFEWFFIDKNNELNDKIALVAVKNNNLHLIYNHLYDIKEDKFTVFEVILKDTFEIIKEKIVPVPFIKSFFNWINN